MQYIKIYYIIYILYACLLQEHSDFNNYISNSMNNLRAYNPITGQSSAIIASQILDTEFEPIHHNIQRVIHIRNIERRVFNRNFNHNRYTKK